MYNQDIWDTTLPNDEKIVCFVAGMAITLFFVVGVIGRR